MMVHRASLDAFHGLKPRRTSAERTASGRSWTPRDGVGRAPDVLVQVEVAWPAPIVAAAQILLVRRG